MNALAPHRYAFSQSPCGGVALEVCGHSVVLRCQAPCGCPPERLLNLADLHLEKGSAYAARGQMLPPYDTRDTLARLAAEAGSLSPRAIVLLGDSFHDGGGEERLCTDDMAMLTAISQAIDLIWVVGNHDADGPRALPGQVSGNLSIGGLRLNSRADGRCPGGRDHRPSASLRPGEGPAAPSAPGAAASSPTGSGSSCRPSAPWPAA